MESALLQIIGGSGAGGVLLYFLFKLLEKKVDTTVSRVEEMHGQAMEKIENLTDKLSDLATSTAVHAKELQHGDKRFETIEEEISRLRENQHSFRDTLHYVKNKMVTTDQIVELLKGK